MNTIEHVSPQVSKKIRDEFEAEAKQVGTSKFDIDENGQYIDQTTRNTFNFWLVSRIATFTLNKIPLEQILEYLGMDVKDIPPDFNPEKTKKMIRFSVLQNQKEIGIRAADNVRALFGAVGRL